MTESTASRIAFLRERVEAAEAARNRATFDVPFRQKQLTLVKVEVPIGFPLYNIHSGRTHRAQTEWIEQNERAGFFADPEDEGVQRVQHGLLLSMIEDRGLAEDLDKRHQRNPIVLTYDGFIIDGNRRVAALRDRAYIENVVAVVLPPDATRSEIFETELELQMARETRAEYNWIDRALHVRYGVRELGEKVASVAERMNVPEDEVDQILARLLLVDQYLDWLGTPDAYHRVRAESEQSFIELAQRDSRSQFQNLPAPLKRAYRLACFGVIQSDDGGYMDVRRVADSIRTQASEVVARTRDRLPSALAELLDEPVAVADNANGDDILSRLAAAERQPGVAAGAELVNIVSDPQNAHVSSRILMEVARELDEERREAQSHLDALRKVERVLQLLRGVQIGNETRRLNDVAARLAEVIAETERLTGEIGDRASQNE